MPEDSGHLNEVNLKYAAAAVVAAAVACSTALWRDRWGLGAECLPDGLALGCLEPAAARYLPTDFSFSCSAGPQLYSNPHTKLNCVLLMLASCKSTALGTSASKTSSLLLYRTRFSSQIWLMQHNGKQ